MSGGMAHSEKQLHWLITRSSSVVLNLPLPFATIALVDVVLQLWGVQFPSLRGFEYLFIYIDFSHEFPAFSFQDENIH